MEFVPTAIPGVWKVCLKALGDSRGRFKRLFCERDFSARGLNGKFVQMNHSITLGKGTVRGLHFQMPPAAEDKLVSCTLGRAFDVAVDLRATSPTFLKWAAVEIDETTAVYIPKGCAHGFQALADETHLIYLHSAFYSPSLEGGVRYDDPTLAIEWPIDVRNLSQRDGSFPLLSETFEGIPT